MKWLGASGAIVAGLILAGVGTRLMLAGGAAAMRVVGRHRPLPRAKPYWDLCVPHLGAIFGFPLMLMWLLMGFGD